MSLPSCKALSELTISGTSASTETAPATCGIQGWADLPGGPLQSIVALLGSFIDLLAFASTCRSWRAAFLAYPSKSRFCALFPPLLVRPNIPVHAPDGHERRWQVIDLANPKADLCCQIPQEICKAIHFAGSSYGQLICGLRKDCLIVDVFTGARVWAPPLPLNEDTFFYSGMLTAPLALQNSHLLVCVVSSQHSVPASLLDWSVGSDSWSEIQLGDSLIEQIVAFNGQFIAMDSYYRLYTLSLAPQLGLQEMITVWWDDNDMHGCPFQRPCLVVCSDTLLIVDYYFCVTSSGAPVNYKAYRLDMSTEPATWVEVVKLENDALFIGGDVRSPPVSCKSPGRWGGRSNCLYYAHYKQPWVLHGLGDDVDAVWDGSTEPGLGFKRDWYIQLQPFWVYPSMFYSDGQQ